MSLDSERQDKRISKNYITVLSGMKIFEIFTKIGQFTPNFPSFSAFCGNIFGHYLWDTRYISEVKFLKQAHVYLLSYQIICLSLCQLVFVK